jgi:N-acetylneuraminate synthase
MEPWPVKFSEQDTTRYDYWKRMEFTEPQWLGLKKHADERGLKFLSSPFSVEAVELLTRVGVAAWKIASGEMSNTPMFERIVATKLPVILSSGMSSLSEIDKAVERVNAKGLPLTVLQCTSLYPCPPERIGLNLIPFFRERYGCAVGLSDHSGTIYPGLAAAALGIEFLEVHITLSREMFGPDVPVSLTTTELQQLVDGVRFIQQMNAHPLDKDTLALEMQPVRDLFTKSVVARIDLAAGSVLRQEDLTVKKPGTGIPASELEAIIGRVLRHSVRADQILHESDLI